MFTSTVKLISLFALLGAATALPENRSVDRRADKQPSNVTLSVAPYMVVESPAKSDNVKGWGGSGPNYWAFAFDGKDYVKESFVYTLYKQDGKWDPKDIKQEVVKKFDCTIDAKTTVTDAQGAVSLSSTDPWIKFTGDVEGVLCKVKA